MNALFVFCEGPHDANFLGRLLVDSGYFSYYKEKSSRFPKPLNNFLKQKINDRNIDEIIIGKPNTPLVPTLVLKSKCEKTLILPISIGGMYQNNKAKNFIKEIFDGFSSDILDRPEMAINRVSVLFVYDANSRGVNATKDLFVKEFSDFITDLENFSQESWIKYNEHALSLFIFTNSDQNTGSLEDIIIEAFKASEPDLLSKATKHIDDWFEEKGTEEDEISYLTKRKKSILTICGQSEKKCSGYALSVIIRDTRLLKDSFDFSNTASQPHRLKRLVDTAFSK